MESGKEWFKVAKKSWLPSWKTKASSTRHNNVTCKTNPQCLTAVSDDPEYLMALTPYLFKAAQAYADIIWKRRLEKIVHNGTWDWTRLWVCMAYRWFFKTLWIQAGKIHWDLNWQQRCCAISECQNGTWTTKSASLKFIAKNLRWCFRGLKRVGDVDATWNQLQERSNCKR